ncbi:MAG: hypothetical protein ACK5V3_12795 [Bdellovibrionales bacterium]
MSEKNPKRALLNKMRPFLVLIGLVVIIVFVDSVFIHFIFPLKKQKIMDRLNQRVSESLAKDPPSESLKPIKNADFITVSKNCLGSGFSAFNTFPNDYILKFPIKNRNIELENFHYKTKENKNFRIHILHENLQSKKEVQLFEIPLNLPPQPIPLTIEERKLPPEVLIENLKSRGEVFHHETKERWHLNNGNVLIVSFENTRLAEFQLFTDTKTFTCELSQCFCF